MADAGTLQKQIQDLVKALEAGKYDARPEPLVTKFDMFGEWPLKKEPAVDRDRYPHKCPLCKSPAYDSGFSVECTKKGCRHYKEP